jgi:phosphatidate cytidylyltransferase
MKEANKNLLVRILSAAILAPLFVLVLIWERPAPFIVLINCGVLVALAEFYWITLRDDPRWMRVAGVALGVLVSLTMAWCPHPDALVVALIGASLAAAILHLVRFGELQTAAARSGLMVFGFVYIALLITPLGLFKRLPDGEDWIFLTCTVVWFADTGAYAVGRMLGKRKLYRAISPGKSVEGAIGGLAFSFGAAVLAKLWYMPQLTWLDAVLISLPASALGQTGDLVESMIKRGYQVKDSGWIIPGHGGLLDRVDALLFATPYIYFYARLLFPLGGSG